jgi:hypothetical protein
MGLVDEMKKAIWKKQRGVEDDETDASEMQEAGISIRPGDPRLQQGVRQGNMTPSEREKLRRLRKQKG